MPVNTTELLKAISIVMDNANVRVCVNRSAQSAIVCGVMCFAGGFLMGPIGLLIGGSLGGLTGYAINKGAFVSIGHILMKELTEDEIDQLLRHLHAAVADVGVKDLASLIPLLFNEKIIQEKVIQVVTNFLKNEMRMSIVVGYVTDQ